MIWRRSVKTSRLRCPAPYSPTIRKSWEKTQLMWANNCGCTFVKNNYHYHSNTHTDIYLYYYLIIPYVENLLIFLLIEDTLFFFKFIFSLNVHKKPESVKMWSSSVLYVLTALTQYRALKLRTPSICFLTAYHGISTTV